MTAKMEIFFNGTGLGLPFNDVNIFNEFKNEQLERAKEIPYHIRFNILFELQKHYNKYIFEESKCNIRRYSKTKFYDKVFGECLQRGGGMGAVCIWTGCVMSLIQEGKLKENNLNGFRGITVNPITKKIIKCNALADIDMLLDGNEAYLILDVITVKEIFTTCNFCNKPSKHRCRDCFTYYCGHECQKADWSKHKEECVEIKNKIKPRSGKEFMSILEF
jgi:hypothetical protein